MDMNSLSHTKWNCKYHIVFAPKYRRKEFYGVNRLEIGAILRQLCSWKDVEIITAEVFLDHVHMFVSISPKLSISSFMGFLKGKSSVMIYERWGNMKFKYRNRQFWCRGYYLDTGGKNMKMIKRLKEEFPSKVIIASIMGRDDEEWKYLAKEVTKAGADLIELNFSCPNMKHKGTGSDVGQNPNLVDHYTRIVKENTNLPILAKMTPNIIDMRKPAVAAKKGGANGISAINTIKSITNIDLDSLIPEPQVNGKSALGGYSGHAVKPIALRFISEMVNCEALTDMCFSGMGGIYTWKHAVEFMLLGCSSVQITTAIMEYGYRIIDDLLLGLKIFMREKNYKKVSDFVGISKSNVINNDKLENDTIEFPIINHEKCIGCGRCYISCRNGGHEAIKFDEKRQPSIDGSKCVGCHLCRLICPQSAIGKSLKRIIINKKSN